MMADTGRERRAEEWCVVVEPFAAAMAEVKFEEWKRQNPEIANRLKPADILIDTIRSNSGALKRYRIRQSVA